MCVKEEEKSPAKKKMCMWKCIWIECVNNEEDNELVVIALQNTRVLGRIFLGHVYKNAAIDSL